MSQDLQDTLHAQGQSHLLRWWDELSADQQSELAAQIRAVDFDEVSRLASSGAGQGSASTAAEQSQRAVPSSQMVRLPQTPEDLRLWAEAAADGRAVLAEGRVGVILVAGGQGTRLGFPHPKGMYPIGPVSGKPMFQLLVEQVIARGRQTGVSIPYYVMTSAATHAETVEFFAQHGNFGLDAGDVKFFQQGAMPAVDAESGQLLLAEKGRLATSPDGHGGVLAALARSGMLRDMRERGIDLLFYHQVDNPLCRVCDPAFLGFHVKHQSEATTKVVAKTGPEERMGVVVDVDGKTQIIEYSDLPPEIAALTDESGDLLFWAGSTAIHIFNREFLERLTDGEIALPFHIAHKQVPYVDEAGRQVEPANPNAYKFERFIFDVLPLAEQALVVEAAREDEFNPLKNAEGVNSPPDVKSSLVALHRRWLRGASIDVPETAQVEISPLAGVDEEAVATSAYGRLDFTGPLYVEPAD